MQPGFPISTQLYIFLRRAISELKLEPGTRISENDLAEYFKVSRQPIREAMFRLRHIELIEVYPQKGSYVKKISLSKVADICLLRSSIECGALRQAIIRGGPAFQKGIELLEPNLEAQRELAKQETSREQWAEFLELDNAYHEIICNMSGSDLPFSVITDLKANVDRIRYLSAALDNHLNQIVEIHTSMYERLKHKDSKVFEIMDMHLHALEQDCHPIRALYPQWFADEED